MHRRGFALIEIILAVAVLAVVASAAFYIGGLKKSTALPPGIATAPQIIGYASQTLQQYASATQGEQGIVDQLSLPASGQPPTSAKSPAPVHASVAVASATDPLAGLGGDIYADGILPLGDYKYTTTGPRKGYVYLCNVVQGGGGAQEDGPWIGSSTWNSNGKIAVEGNISWPSASVSIGVNGDTRTIQTNDLPVGATTGIFPIQPSDPSYQYDQNPNSIVAQDLSFSLPTDPTLAAAPSCIYGEVGVMTNGVLLLDAFDAEYRDAGAHEIQDSCEGHPHEGGVYHYHSLSSCIPNATETNIIGWAFDGFPITGPEISPGRYLTTADLDECHGITSPIAMNGTMVTMYHYVMTQDFPYSVGCFRGISHEPTPGANAGQSPGQGPSSGQSGGTPPAPPQAAIDACSGKALGDSCSVGQGMSGMCATIGTYVACKP